MVLRSTVSNDVRRLAGVLMQWKDASVSDASKVTGIDKGNLSRFVGDRSGPSISPRKVALLLRYLNWGPTGPTANVVHRWKMQEEDDLRWMFGMLLQGSANLRPVFSHPVSQDLLTYEDLVVAEWQGAWLVVSQRIDTTVPITTSATSLLRVLLDKRNALGTARGFAVVEDVAALKRLDAGDVSPSGLAALLDASPETQLWQEAHQLLRRHFAIWLTKDRLRALLDDGLTRFARSESEELVHQMLAEHADGGDRVERGRSPTADETRLKNAKRKVSELAGRAFNFEWQLHPAPIKTTATSDRAVGRARARRQTKS